ncbi:MAG: tape measure protein, partial [Leptolyngbyaceae cyanobacterium RM2_2_4]|nr:tape measure protein [Leptolyngbyaceae cyanobacterium RM2_2_4]
MQSLDRNIKQFAIRRDVATREYAQFLGATRGTALEGAPASNIFESISQASRVYGLSDDRQSQAFLAVTQMISKQRVETEELKRQLSEALPSAYSTFAKALGVSQSELNELIRTNQVGLEEISKFAAQLKSDTALGLEASNNLLQVRINEFSNASQSLQKAFGDVALEPAKGLLNGLTAILQLLADNIGAVVGAFVALSAQLIVTFLPVVIKVIAALGSIAWPVAAVVALTAALGGLIGAMIKSNQESPAIKRIKELGETAQKSRNQLRQLREEEEKRRRGSTTTENAPTQRFGQNPSKDANELERALKRFNRDVGDNLENPQRVRSNFSDEIAQLQERVNKINAEISIVRAESSTIEGIDSRREELLQRESRLRAEADGINQKIAAINTGLAAEVEQVKAFVEILEDKKNDDFKINQLYQQNYARLRSILAGLTTEQQRIRLVVNSVNEGFAKMTRTIRDLREETEQLSRILERQELQAQSRESQALSGDTLEVDSDDRVIAGERTTVGYVGSTGASTGAHIDARMADRKGPPPKEVLDRIVVNGKPLSQSPVTSPYGYRIHPIYGDRRMHHGIDYAGGNVVQGAPIQVQGLRSATTARDPGGGGIVVTLKLEGFNREVQLLHNDRKTENLYGRDGAIKLPARPRRQQASVLDGFDQIPRRSRQQPRFNQGYERLGEVDQALLQNRIFQQDPVARAVALMIAGGESGDLQAGNRANLWQQMSANGMRGPFQFYTKYHDAYTRTREQQVNTIADMLAGRRTRANGVGRIDLSPIRRGVANGTITTPQQLLAATQRIIPIEEWHGLHRSGGGERRIMQSGAAAVGLDLIRQSTNAPTRRQQSAPPTPPAPSAPQAAPARGRLTPESALEINRRQRQIANTEQLIQANQSRFNALRQQVRDLNAIPANFLDREGRPNPTAIDRVLEERKDDPKLQETGRILKEFAEVATELDKLQRQRTTLL